MNSNWEKLKNRVKEFPQSPGVYLMKSQNGKVIYVGKAKVLRHRVRSYFNQSQDQSVKTLFLIQSVTEIDYIPTATELEALLLEAQLIKKYRPRYNVRLKDDKSYPYIKISWNDSFPRLYLARRVKADGSLYFGPYPRGQVVAHTIRFLNETFKIRDCSDGFFKSRTRPCLSYQINKCTGPCVGLVSEEEYRKQIVQARDFLQGDSDKILSELEQKMWELANQEMFEEAARVRDSWRAIKEAALRQQSTAQGMSCDLDIIGYHGDERGLLFETLHMRRGHELGSRSYFFKIAFDQLDFRDHLLSFLTQYYEDQFIPDQVLLPIDLGQDLNRLLENLLKERSNKQVMVRFAGDQLGVTLLEKANQLAQSHFIAALARQENVQEGLKEIQERFHLINVPYRIDCFDVSTFQGTATVASRVSMEDGVLAPHWYRRYRIRSVQGTNDYEALKEVLKRSYDEPQEGYPDLILIDGGRGQLRMAQEALRELGLNIPMVSLAKARTESDFAASDVFASLERFYLPGRTNPIIFRSSSMAYRILVQLRDEAHRFALSYHRKLRDQDSFKSLFDQLDQIGEKRKKVLLAHFGSLQDLIAAGVEKIADLPGFNRTLAESVWEQAQALSLRFLTET
ncbi:MAG: excinuclease ABC subunit UvrC [Bdellovibrionaceae bacterium]|nr:excinuclease ABC subunit UvrC [Pseudobdellovibrionaceae bacterium]MDW8190472.1 excinuclease ABC subunit UvrC [Pseudobdellovibrionaceae bacterium]